MILQLGKRRVSVKRMKIPEPINKMYIQYVFEFNTNHLTPRLTVDKTVFEGNRIYIDLEKAARNVTEGLLPIVVELIDDLGLVKAVYKGKLPYYRYAILGKKPMRPNVEGYIRELEARIEELSNEGEVI